LQGLGNQQNISYRKTLEKSKSLQGLQEFGNQQKKIIEDRNRGFILANNTNSGYLCIM